MPCTEAVNIKSAKKIHRCLWCWTQIKIGESYTKYRWYDGGDADTVKMHPECYTAMNKLVDIEGGSIEFGAGENQRGHFCGGAKDCDCLTQLA